jgi:predicted peptidase
MKTIVRILCSIPITFLVACSSNSKISLPSEKRLEYIKEEFTHNNFTLPFNIIYPEKAKGKLPLIIFLHGSGERGKDNQLQLKHGGQWIKENIKNFPAIAIFPQCPTNDYWSNVLINTDANGNRSFNFETEAPATKSMQALMTLIESYSKLPYVDQNRIYVIGLSMGGMGTLELLWRIPGKFAAAAPICGGVNPNKIKEVSLTKGIWIFHGNNDTVVLPKYSLDIVNALKKIGKDVIYSEYQGVGHDSWNNVFKEKDFFKWLFSNKNNNK